MRVHFRPFIALTVLLAAGAARAQEQIFRAVPGAKQFGIMGNGAFAEGASTYRAVLEGGYYVTDRLVALGRLGIVKASPENRFLLVGARYEFSSSGMAVPYLVAGVEFHNGARPTQTAIPTDPFDPNATFCQGGIGTNIFLNANVAAFVEIVAFRNSSNSRTGTDLQLGLRMFFK